MVGQGESSGKLSSPARGHRYELRKEAEPLQPKVVFIQSWEVTQQLRQQGSKWKERKKKEGRKGWEEGKEGGSISLA